MDKNTEKTSFPTLTELLSKDTILVKTSASDWKDAVKKAIGLLIRTGAVEPRYVEAAIKLCEENQAYIVVAPGMAITHARPGDGVKHIGFSVVTLEKPVYFGRPIHDPVDLIIALAATDNKSHVKALAQLAKILMNDETVAKLRNSKTKKEILEIVRSYSS